VPADTAYLEGGPCAGKTRKITAAESDSGTIICQGETYSNADGAHRPNGDIIFKYAPALAGGSGGTQTLKAPQALKGWKSIRKAWNQTLPTALQYSTRGNKAALRSLRRARKVRL
jgi:hypothetical protein